MIKSLRHGLLALTEGFLRPVKTFVKNLRSFCKVVLELLSPENAVWYTVNMRKTPQKEDFA